MYLCALSAGLLRLAFGLAEESLVLRGDAGQLRLFAVALLRASKQAAKETRSETEDGRNRIDEAREEEEEEKQQ